MILSLHLGIAGVWHLILWEHYVIKCILWIWLISEFSNGMFQCSFFPTAVDDVLAVDGSKNEDCRVELCCGVLHYVVLCGRMKIRGHYYTRAAGLSAKRGWGVFAVWWRVFLLTWWCSKYSPQHPFSLLNLLFAEKYKQGFQTLGGNNDIHLVWPVVHWSLHYKLEAGASNKCKSGSWRLGTSNYKEEIRSADMNEYKEQRTAGHSMAACLQ